MPSNVKRRHVFHIAGYDPITPDRQYRRFVRQLTIFCDTWEILTSASRSTEKAKQLGWSVTAQASDWHTETEYELLPWHQVVFEGAGRSDTWRLLRGFLTYVDLILTGTLPRYARANSRYFLFAIFPLVQLALIGLISFAGAVLCVHQFGSIEPWNTIATVVITVALFAILLKWPGRRLKIQHALDDWIFSVDYIRGRRPDMEELVTSFAKRLVERAQQGGIDEIIVVGHSLGALFAVETVAQALESDRLLGQRGVPINILTVGATIPKCTLHPASTSIRQRVQRVADDKAVFWAEFQARADAISFYRFHPVDLRRVDDASEWRRPVVRRVQIKDMLRPETFAKYRFHVLRLHYQFIMANNRRSAYDYFMMVCGPIAFREWTTAPLGFLSYFSQHAGGTQRILKND